MKRFNVEYIQLTTLEAMDIKAKTKKEAEEQAFRQLHKYDRDSYDFVLVNEVGPSDGVIDETERIVKEIA